MDEQQKLVKEVQRRLMEVMDLRPKRQNSPNPEIYRNLLETYIDELEEALRACWVILQKIRERDGHLIN